MGREKGEVGGNGTENKECGWWVQGREGEVRNSTGNREAKEFICMTHGHELRWGNDGRKWGTGWRGIKKE